MKCSSRHGRRGPSRTTPARRSSTDTTKYVVSGTLTDATWRNSQIVGAYDPDAIRALKDEVHGNRYDNGVVYLAYRAHA